MGANAQIEVPAFTAGQVLTAAEMTQINTGIPVFATTTTRDAAFGGAGEKVLAQGQYAYIEATSALQVYNGSAWVSAIVSGLNMVKAQTSFTTSASVTADSVFTSSYADYLVLVSVTTSGSNNLAFKLRAGGTSTSTNYNKQTLTVTGTSVSGAQLASQTSLVTETSNGNFPSLVVLHINNPQVATNTLIKLSGTFFNASNTNSVGIEIYANQNSSTQFDGIELLTATGTITGSYQIYGYNKTI